MTGLLRPTVINEIGTLDKLLQVLVEPEAQRAKLAELKIVAENAQVVLDKASAGVAQLAEKEQELVSRKATLDSDTQLLRDAEAEFHARHVALNQSAQELATSEADLAAREQRFNGRQSQAEADLVTREQALVDKTAAQAAEMATRERTVTEREAGAKAAFDEAQAVKSDYEQRTAALNAAMGK